MNAKNGHPMREIVLDTETTGLDPEEGHRVIEIGCLELDAHVPTGRTFYRLIDPERDIPEEAARVHGITRQKLEGAPVFAAVVDDFLAFIADAPLVMHNAEFDLKFLNAELSRLSRASLDATRSIDTLALARRRFPGARASLDELCRRFGVDLSGRSLHGALIDAELLAQVYLELIGGRQARLALAPGDGGSGANESALPTARARPYALPERLTAEEREAHARFLASALSGDVLWRREG